MFAIITGVLLLMSLMVVISFPFILRYQSNKDNESTFAPKQNKRDNEDIKSMWEIENIKDGVIHLTYSRYRLILRLSSADFFLLSIDEQTNVEDALIMVLMGMSFPVQILTTSEAVDTRNIIADIKENIDTKNPQMREYASQFILHLESMRSQKASATRNSFIALSFDTNKGSNYAYDELMARANILAEGLRLAKINCEVLRTAAVVDLLHHLFNRGNLWRPSEADKVGLMDPFLVSERQLTFSP